MDHILNIAVLLTCYNRKNKTLKCLRKLYAQQGLNINYAQEVFLVDDSSTDGTAQQIAIEFPKVKIIEGNGNLYWNRGMHLAWETAVATREYDYYLWLNDDTFLFENAIAEMLFCLPANSIISGTTSSFVHKNPTYGGFNDSTKDLIKPTGQFQECGHINGNCVLISNKVFQLVGNTDPIFHHALGDFDYGLRAKKLGVKLYVAPNYIGTCESHSSIPGWRSTSETLFNRFKYLYAPASGCHPFQYFVFDKRHNGLGIAILHIISIHIRAIIPGLWKV